MKNIAAIRKEYNKKALDKTHVKPNPVEQFMLWFNEAIEANVLEVNAMNLATVNTDGRPSSRMVLLKGIENEKFVFYTNYQSNKGKDLESNPVVALNFFWAELERQVRIEGIASRVSVGRAEEYFHSRPRESQIGAWTSPQSSIIESREILEERYKKMEERFKGQNKIPMPKQWGGFEVSPFMMEFWQGRPSRLHDRICYTLIDKQWKINVLAP